MNDFLRPIFQLKNKGSFIIGDTFLKFHYQVTLTTGSFLTLSLSIHPSISSIAPGKSSKLHPVSAQN